MATLIVRSRSLSRSLATGSWLYVRVALETSVRVDAKTVVANCLETCPWIGAEYGNVREAALLVGASARLHDELGSTPIRDRYESELFVRIRESLGEDAYADAVQRGREMALDEATACALRATGNLG